MSRLARWTAAGVLASALGCSLGSPGPTTNRGACEAYVSHMNGLETCMGVRYEVDNLCQASDSLPPEMAGYYDCLREHTGCDGATPRLDLDECTPPLLSIAASTGS